MLVTVGIFLVTGWYDSIVLDLRSTFGSGKSAI